MNWNLIRHIMRCKLINSFCHICRSVYQSCLQCSSFRYAPYCTKKVSPNFLCLIRSSTFHIILENHRGLSEPFPLILFNVLCWEKCLSVDGKNCCGVNLISSIMFAISISRRSFSAFLTVLLFLCSTSFRCCQSFLFKS